MVHEICIGEQNGWYHDEGHTLGVFHTYDTFTLNGMTRKRLRCFLVVILRERV